MIDIRLVPDSEMKSICKLMIKGMTEFYKNPENQKRYEEWHLNKYGELPKNASYMRSNNLK